MIMNSRGSSLDVLSAKVSGHKFLNNTLINQSNELKIKFMKSSSR